MGERVAARVAAWMDGWREGWMDQWMNEYSDVPLETRRINWSKEVKRVGGRAS